MIVAAGGGLPGPGYTFIADESVATDLWRVLTAQVTRASRGWAAPIRHALYSALRCPPPAKRPALESHLLATSDGSAATVLPSGLPAFLPPFLPHLQEGVEPMGADCWEMARVAAGRPALGAELAQDFNPLEAGLYHAASLTKGCSIGQETISKVGAGGRLEGQPPGGGGLLLWW